VDNLKVGLNCTAVPTGDIYMSTAFFDPPSGRDAYIPRPKPPRLVRETPLSEPKQPRLTLKTRLSTLKRSVFYAAETGDTRGDGRRDGGERMNDRRGEIYRAVAVIARQRCRGGPTRPPLP
jgi:hypothetical protein